MNWVHWPASAQYASPATARQSNSRHSMMHAHQQAHTVYSINLIDATCLICTPNRGSCSSRVEPSRRIYYNYCRCYCCYCWLKFVAPFLLFFFLWWRSHFLRVSIHLIYLRKLIFRHMHYLYVRWVSTARVGCLSHFIGACAPANSDSAEKAHAARALYRISTRQSVLCERALINGSWLWGWHNCSAVCCLHRRITKWIYCFEIRSRRRNIYTADE